MACAFAAHGATLRRLAYKHRARRLEWQRHHPRQRGALSDRARVFFGRTRDVVACFTRWQQEQYNNVMCTLYGQKCVRCKRLGTPTPYETEFHNMIDYVAEKCFGIVPSLKNILCILLVLHPAHKQYCQGSDSRVANLWQDGTIRSAPSMVIIRH